MRNEASTLPFPQNFFEALGADCPRSFAEDFVPTFSYVVRCITTSQGFKAVLGRFRNGMTYEKIGETLGLTKQRAYQIVESALDAITGNYVLMLQKGMKQYMNDLLAERIAELGDVISDSERQRIEQEAYTRGYQDANAGAPPISDTMNGTAIDSLTLSPRTTNALFRNGVSTIGEFIRCGDDCLMYRSFGKSCFEEVLDAVMNNFNTDISFAFPKAVKKWGIVHE